MYASSIIASFTKVKRIHNYKPKSHIANKKQIFHERYINTEIQFF